MMFYRVDDVDFVLDAIVEVELAQKYPDVHAALMKYVVVDELTYFNAHDVITLLKERGDVQ